MRHTSHRNRRTLPLGTISQATLRPEDVIPALLDAAGDVRMTRADRTRVRELAKEWAAREPGGPDSNDTEIWGDLLDVLQAYAPDYCYVGSNEGDGADIGVWPSIDSIVDDRVPRLDRYPTASDEGPHFAHVNDHGNVTLYRRAGSRWVECWSRV